MPEHDFLSHLHAKRTFPNSEDGLISKTAEYALRAVLFIARETESGGLARAHEVAEALDLPANYLSKIPTP